MNAKSKVAIGLIFSAVMGLGYGGLRYSNESRRADPDPGYTVVRVQHRVNVTAMNDSVAILLGTLLAMSREQAPTHAAAAQPRLTPEAAGDEPAATPEAFATADVRSDPRTTDDNQGARE